MFTIETPTAPLAEALTLEPGYTGVSWAGFGTLGLSVDREIPPPLLAFLKAVRSAVRKRDLLHLRHTGPAYLRIIDAGEPENYMRWHRDNVHDGGLRFSTAIATDGAPVNMLFTTREEWVGLEVMHTRWRTAEVVDPGVIAAFSNDIHGVRPQNPRPGQRTAVFFTTLHASREAADLHTTNNTSGFTHAVLPTLEAARTPQATP